MTSIIKAPPMLIDPLIFTSYYRPQIWGGRGLQTVLGRLLPDEAPYGEAWDLSPLPLHVSQVDEGQFAGTSINDLWENHRQELAGDIPGHQFPLLVKWLECRDILSLQVHPDNEMAQRVLGEPHGKSEAWVVVHAEPSARVYAGLKPGVGRKEVESLIKAGRLIECLHSFVPMAGDCISLPAGTIHAAGGSLIVAEVQQSSDATFRLYDWNRLGLDGRPRPLQVERAIEAINWDQGSIYPIVPKKIPTNREGVHAERLVDGIAFRMERYIVDQSMPSPNPGEMTVWMILEGRAEVRNRNTGYCREVVKGQTIVIPAQATDITWESLDPHSSLTLLCTRLAQS